MKPWIDGEFVISTEFGHIYYLTHAIAGVWCEEICTNAPRVSLQSDPRRTNCLLSNHPAQFRRFATNDLRIGDEFDYNQASWEVVECDDGVKRAARDGTKDKWALHHFRAHEIFVTKIVLDGTKFPVEPTVPMQIAVDLAGADGDDEVVTIGSIPAGGKYPDDFVPLMREGEEPFAGVAPDAVPVLVPLSLVPKGSWVKTKGHHRPVKYLNCPDKFPVLENIHGFKFHFEGVTLDTLVEVVPDTKEAPPAREVGITERLDALLTYLDDASERINAAQRDVAMIKKLCGVEDNPNEQKDG